MKKSIVTLLMLIAFTGSAAAELTKKDMEDIRRIVKEELQHIDNRFDSVDKRSVELREDMNKRFEQVDKRFEQMMGFMWILATIFSGLVAAIFGFAIWDRRTMVRPFEVKTEEIERKVKEIDEVKLKNLIAAFRDLARIDNNVADVMKKFNLM